jgi:hypothetical protein
MLSKHIHLSKQSLPLLLARLFVDSQFGPEVEDSMALRYADTPTD